MTVPEIRDMILKVNEFEDMVEQRVNQLLKLSGSKATFDRIIWQFSDEENLCSEVSISVDEKPWSVDFPTKCFSDDFNIEDYMKEKRTSVL